MEGEGWKKDAGGLYVLVRNKYWLLSYFTQVSKSHL